MLRERHQDKISILIQKVHAFLLYSARLKPFLRDIGKYSEWKLVVPLNIPQQTNSSDCGVFALEYLERVSRDVAFDFNQSDMLDLRKMMMLEILTGKLVARLEPQRNLNLHQVFHINLKLLVYILIYLKLHQARYVTPKTPIKARKVEEAVPESKVIDLNLFFI